MTAFSDPPMSRDEGMLDRLAEVVAQVGYENSPIYRPEKFVRAILLALREPSEGMLLEGVEFSGVDDSDMSDLRAAWQAMIDRILSETPR